jgi:hypothetical protein
MGWSPSRPYQLYSCEKDPWYQLNKRQGGPLRRSGHFRNEKKKISYVCRESNQDSLVVQPTYYTDYTIPAAFKNVGVSKLQQGTAFFRSILQPPASPQPVLVALWNITRHCFTQRPTEKPVDSKMELHMANRKRLFSFSKL